MGTVKKKKIVIIPGWTYTLNKWSAFIRYLEDAGLEVRILEVPGLVVPSSKVWDIVKFVEWLQNELTKEKSKVILLGHSNGGRIAIAYVSRNPKNIEKLVLLDSAGIYHNELPVRFKRFVFRKASQLGRLLKVSNKFRWVLYKLAREHDYEKASENMQKTMKNLIYTNLTPMMRKIKLPTLILWGEKDKITSVSDGKVMSENIKGSRFLKIKDAGHAPFYTHPKETLELLLKNI